MRTAIHLLFCLCSVLLLTACGDEPDTSDNDPAPRVEADDGPVVPETGVVVIQVNPNRPYPASLYPAGTPVEAMIDDLLGRIALHNRGDIALHAERVGQSDRVRFWVITSDDRSDADRAALADAIADEVTADIVRAFSEGWGEAKASLEVSIAEARGRFESAQAELRRYREARRGLPDTPESRRRMAQLDHAVNARNDEVGELQNQMRTIDEEHARGQRVFRRLLR